MNFMTGPADPKADPLNLDNIRRTLVRLEDTIIFLLIERAQFAHNPRMYTEEGFADVLYKDNGFKGSWLMWLLKETETSHGQSQIVTHDPSEISQAEALSSYFMPPVSGTRARSFAAKIRRYDSPDEYPFTPRSQLPSPILPPLSYPPLLHPQSIYNANSKILDFYINSVIPVITRQVTKEMGKENDDGNYGSAATRDVECLQAISRRIHCGMFVSESKFLSSPASFIPHILNPNPEALEALITKPSVEAALLVRLEKKARWYGAELGSDGTPLTSESEGKTKVDVGEVVRLYRDFVIPLTKDVEVEYLLKRLDGLTQGEIEELKKRG